MATTDLVGVVFNPAKQKAVDFCSFLKKVQADHELGPFLFYPTTEDSPGTEQARQALADHASVVIAAGGDGTVRAVAAGMAHSNVPMSIAALGTANLFARNLQLPVLDTRAMLRIALSGEDKGVDLGMIAWMDTETGRGRQEPFCVIGGMGFDAAMISDTDPRLKKAVGWPAYFVSGIQHMADNRLRARLEIDGESYGSVSARTIMVANCGRLPAGLMLLPDARLDDGVLDVALVDTRRGIMGWTSLAGQVMLRGFGLRLQTRKRFPGRVDEIRCREVAVTCSETNELQLDGDLVGHARAFKAWIEPGALILRVRP